MADTHSAGSGDDLSAVRYGWEHSAPYERIAGAEITPGMAVMPAVSGGTEVFQPHDGSADAELYIAVEARGRGMDLNSTYPADDKVKTLKPAEETGFNVLLLDGEDVSDGDALVVDGSGVLAAYASADDDVTDIVGYAAEDLDLSSAGENDHVGMTVE